MAKPALLVNVRMSGPTVPPMISRHDYRAFSRLNGSDLPKTYDEWLEIVAELKRLVGESRNIVEERPVELREFVLYCNLRGLEPNKDSLMIFVREKTAGRKY